MRRFHRSITNRVSGWLYNLCFRMMRAVRSARPIALNGRANPLKKPANLTGCSAQSQLFGKEADACTFRGAGMPRWKFWPKKDATSNSRDAHRRQIMLFGLIVCWTCAPAYAQPTWAKWTSAQCTGPGVRQYYAVLQGIPFGQSWENTCAATSPPTVINGLPFLANGSNWKCANQTTNEFGIAQVPDASCPRPTWGTWSPGQCTAIGTREFSAVLQNIATGQSWENTCAATPPPTVINGLPFAANGSNWKCANQTTNEYGIAAVSDNSCPHWGSFKQDPCSLTGKRQFSSVITDLPTGFDWATGCKQTQASLQGNPFVFANRCSNQKSAMWGEFDIDDATCAAPTTSSHSVNLHCAGTCVYPSPAYINVFWDSPGKWDADIASAGLTATKAAVNAFTATLIGSTYFRGLAQYGVGPPTFVKGIDANAACLGQFPVPPIADEPHIAGFVACEVNSLNLPSTANLIVNVFMPPNVVPMSVDETILGIHFKWGSCKEWGAYHFLTALGAVGKTGAAVPTVPFTVIPTNTQCSADFNSLSQSLSHEMVEAATNPGGFGWYDDSANTVTATGALLTEIGDMCEGPPGGVFPLSSMPFSTGRVQAYWSNQPPGCVYGGLFPGGNPNAVGELVNLNSGKCVDVPSGSTANQVQLQQFACNGGGNQVWHLLTTGQIVNQNSGKCIDVPGGSKADQVQLQQFTCNGGQGQMWKLNVDASVVNKGTGKCLDVPGGSAADKVILQQFTCNGGNNQKWAVHIP
jgi:hypothetical protein